VSDLLQFFEYSHLTKPELRSVGQQFHALAHAMVAELPANPQTDACLNWLLAAKDCAVRAVIYRQPTVDELFPSRMLQDLAEKLLAYQKDGGHEISGS
jgi:ferritin-like protein